LSGKKTLTASLGRLATASADPKSHTLDGPLLLFTARNLSSELKACPTIEATHQYHTTNIHLEKKVHAALFYLKLRSLTDVLVSGSSTMVSMVGHLKTLKCPSCIAHR
jgi:hypothetical protein